ncbi:MAG: NAD-dependent epimerase [Bacteroidales bacterium]|nr:NAD-dependent epimerase [Bacteroidales bacterium]
MKFLVTGAAGFIGYHLTKKLIEEGYNVVGIDNINDYYDVNLKWARLAQLGIMDEKVQYAKEVRSRFFENFTFIKLNLEDNELIRLFEYSSFDFVVNLAAQAGVRYSLINPMAYVKSNMEGFLNLLECCRKYPVKHLVYASSSSVYGLNQKYPFSTHANVDHPVSLYAASKKSNELMAHVYSYLYALPVTGLRFFTVYGPWGRPDMALFKFTKAILEDQAIEVYNNGEMERDFTYIDDIIEGVYRIIFRIPSSTLYWNPIMPDPATSSASYRIFNIGNSQPVRLMDFVEALEKELNRKAQLIFKPLQPGDVVRTYADTSDLYREIGYKPNTPVTVGIRNFVEWYRNYYKI